MDRLERELSEVIAVRLHKHEEALRQTSEEKARRILATAIHRYAAEHTADTTVSTVDIPSDDMKGRIIGREGRNIRTFEKCTGVDVIVDDTPGVVIVSAFDNIRRETARLALDEADPGRPDPPVAHRGGGDGNAGRRWRSTSSRWAGRRCRRRTSARCTRSWCSCWAG